MEICWEGQHEKNRYIWYTKGVSVLPLTAHNIKNVNNSKQKLFWYIIDLYKKEFAKKKKKKKVFDANTVCVSALLFICVRPFLLLSISNNAPNIRHFYNFNF